MQELKQLILDPNEIRENVLKNSIPFRKTRGIYFLIKNEEIIYVGKSENFWERMANHIRRKDFDRYYIIECDGDIDIDCLENDYIIGLKPELNTMINCPEGFVAKKEIWEMFRKGKKWLDDNDWQIRSYKFNKMAYYYLEDVVDLLS